MARILIVDDEPAIRSLLAAVLTREGFYVQTAGNGSQAMAICTAEPFDLVLSDVLMPGMDGHELAQWIATRYPSTPTALMSGYDIGCKGCPRSPRCKLITKPFRPGGVVSFVRAILKSSGALPMPDGPPPSI